MTGFRNALIGLGLALLLPGLAAAAPPAEDPRDVRIRELSDRVSDLERALKDLNAQVEAAARAADLAQGDVKALQARMGGPQATSAAAPAAPPAKPPTPAPAVTSPAAAGPAVAAAATPVAAAEDGLTLGRRQLQGGDARTAEATLTTWLAAAPGDPKAGEGTYLRGRARAQQSAWADAASDYIAALKGWPSTWWAPDAVVELARALERLGKATESCQALDTFKTRYPTASEGARKRAAAVAVQSQCGA